MSDDHILPCRGISDDEKHKFKEQKKIHDEWFNRSDETIFIFRYLVEHPNWTTIQLNSKQHNIP